MNTKTILILVVLVTCFCNKQVYAASWIKPVASMTFDGYVTQDKDRPNTFYGYSVKTGPSGDYYYIKTVMEYYGTGFGISSLILDNGDEYKKLMNSSQNGMAKAFVRLDSSPYIALYHGKIFNKYTVTATLSRFQPPQISSKLTIIRDNDKVVEDFEYGYINTIYYLTVFRKRYIIVSITSCSASMCNDELKAYRLQ